MELGSGTVWKKRGESDRAAAPCGRGCGRAAVLHPHSQFHMDKEYKQSLVRGPHPCSADGFKALGKNFTSSVGKCDCSSWHSCQSPSSSSSSSSPAVTLGWGCRRGALSSCCSLRGQRWSRDRCGDCNYTLWEAASAKPKYALLALVSSRFTSAGRCDSDLSSQIMQNLLAMRYSSL